MKKILFEPQQFKSERCTTCCVAGLVCLCASDFSCKHVDIYIMIYQCRPRTAAARRRVYGRPQTRDPLRDHIALRKRWHEENGMQLYLRLTGRPANTAGGKKHADRRSGRAASCVALAGSRGWWGSNAWEKATPLSILRMRRRHQNLWILLPVPPEHTHTHALNCLDDGRWQLHRLFDSSVFKCFRPTVGVFTDRLETRIHSFCREISWTKILTWNRSWFYYCFSILHSYQYNLVK